MKPIIFKFGGASVKDAAGIRNVASIISKHGHHSGLVIVVSAMGKTTNALEQMLKLALEKAEFSAEWQALKTMHYETAMQLFHTDEKQKQVLQALNGYFEELAEILRSATSAESDFIYDQAVSIGEYLSSFLLSSFLQSTGLPVFLLDASKFIRTNDNWREGEVDMDGSTLLVQKQISPLLKDGFVLTQGFLGGTADGLRTTLGREGSDYTAALLAYFLDADSVSIWKDVPGVLSADPKWMPDAVLLPELSYQDAAELTYYGATVIHPKTIRPLAWKKIPLFVCSFLNPDAKGTLVGPELKKHRQESRIRKTGQVLVSLSSRDFSFMEESNIREVLQAFSDAGLKMQMLQVSATSISVVTDGEERRLEKALYKISSKYLVLFNRNLTLVTIHNPVDSDHSRLLESKKPILVQQTRSTLQVLFPEDQELQ